MARVHLCKAQAVCYTIEAKLQLSLAYTKVEKPHLPLDHGLDALTTRPRAVPPLHSRNPIKLE